MFGIPKFGVLQEEIEKVQNMAARIVTSNYCFGSMIRILKRCESLKKRRRDSRLILLYKSLMLLPAGDLIHPIRHCTS